MNDQQPPASPPAVWWSPSLNTVISRGDHDHVYIDEHFALPADAVRLVPDVSRVRCDWCTGITSLDDEGMVVAHLRPDDGASCPGSHGDDFERVAEQAREARPVYPQVWCNDSSGPNGIGGTCVLGPGHLHRDGLGGEWPFEPSEDTVQPVGAITIDAIAWYCDPCGALRSAPNGAIITTACVCGSSLMTGRGVGRTSGDTVQASAAEIAGWDGAA